MKGKIISILLFLAALLLVRCANQVAPTGGPKDVTPPEVTEAVPENHGVGFNARKIELTFDEYITLNNASQQVLISPPLATKPDIKLNNKTVVIRLKEDLRPNTTYTIDFGEAIKDLHEGNIFKDYTYTFATGDILDTLTLAGTILDAETHKPVDNLFITLYADDTIAMDSLFLRPCRQAPDYIARTDKEGKFQFHGLPDQPFLVFAIEDMNSNLFYDLPNEKLAFLDTLVCPSDSVDLTLSAFTVIDTSQMLLESKLVEEGLLRFAFRRPADSVSIDLSWPAVDSFQMVKVWSANHDTLRCWFTPNVLDSLEVNIHYDTIINVDGPVSLQFRETKQRRGNNPKTMKVATNLHGKLLMPDDDFMLIFPEPITFFNKEDRFEQADEYGMRYRLKMSDTAEYVIRVSDSVFFSVRGHTHDSLDFKFHRAETSEYGNIYIKVSPPKETQVVVQLLDNKDKVIDQCAIDSTTRVAFIQRLPGKYKLQAILDTDGNGHWSPGDFHRRFLPEAIVRYKDELDLKAGWDIDLDEVWEPK